MKNNKFLTKYHQPGKSISKGWTVILLILTFFLGACANVLQNNDDLKDLISSYEAQNEQVAARRAAALKRGIDQLDITQPDKSGGPVKISVELNEARLDVVIKLILDGAKTEYINQNHSLPGTVTARFENRPLVEALTILLGQHRMRASRSGSMIILGPDPSQDKLDQAMATVPDGTDKIHIDWPLENIDILRATEVLRQIYPQVPPHQYRYNRKSDLNSVKFAARKDTNSIILSGTRGDVEDAIRLLDSIDKDSGHVLLEALVVEFNVDSFMDIGARIASGADGEFSNVFIDLANLAGNSISFDHVANAVNTTSFSAILNILIEDEEAIVVSRPYLSTVSGTSAHLEIAEDRYVVAQSPNQSDVTLSKISSGIDLDILPVVTRDQTIMLDISINESQFIPTLGNVEQRLSRNTIKTSAHVDDGETVIIGGLNMRTTAQSFAGIPAVRDIPLVKHLFNREDSVDVQTQVMIFITPHRWEPGLDLPLLKQNDWSIFEQQPANLDPE